MIDADFIFCPTEHLSSLNFMSFDVAVNIASMQEMNAQVVQDYFYFLRNHLSINNLFYCCNRLEKIMSEGEVSRMFEYPWQDRDVHLVDERCPWHKFFFSHHLTARGLQLTENIRVPFVNLFDGEIHHRLSRLVTLSS